MITKSFRKTLYEALRGFQSLFGEARERTFKAISFAKLLRKDLEVSAEFDLTGGFDDLLLKLEDTDHVQVRLNQLLSSIPNNHQIIIKVLAPHSAHHYIFVPKSIADQQDKILQMLDMHCGELSGVMTENKGDFLYNI